MDYLEPLKNLLNHHDYKSHKDIFVSVRDDSKLALSTIINLIVEKDFDTILLLTPNNNMKQAYIYRHISAFQKSFGAIHEYDTVGFYTYHYLKPMVLTLRKDPLCVKQWKERFKYKKYLHGNYLAIISISSLNCKNINLSPQLNLQIDEIRQLASNSIFVEFSSSIVEDILTTPLHNEANVLYLNNGLCEKKNFHFIPLNITKTFLTKTIKSVFD